MKTMTEHYPSIQEILPVGMSTSELLSRLKERVTKTNGGRHPLERGRCIREHFPWAACDTLRLADEALEGKLVLPGTGPDLHFVGNPPKWNENSSGDQEYLYQLNRMHHWKSMCEAYSLTGDLRYAEKVFQELNDWIDANPCPSLTGGNGEPAPSAFHEATPWRALEVGIRGYRTWPYVIELLAETPYMTEDFLEKLLPCIYVHALVLYKISPLLWPKADHNHYLMENLGLLSFSCLFPEMKGSEDFKAHAMKELDRCMAAQCTPCGGQIEGCASYHNGCIFWFAMRNVFSRKFGLPLSEAYTERLRAMFTHSVHATRACGGNFPWGDSHTADKETLCLAAVSCYMAFGDRKYLAIAAHFYPAASILSDIRDNLWRMPELDHLKEDLLWAEEHPESPKLPLLAWQKDLDQVYYHSSWDKQALSLMTACRTPVQNAHAHMDPGGFDFTAFGFPLISDPGIYTYKDGEDRYRFKRAASHNCLTVNERDPWEYFASWDYGPQKNGGICAVEQSDDIVCITSRHENYAPAAAIRHLAVIENRFLIIIDHITGLSAGDTVEIHYHINRTDIACRLPQSLFSQDSGPSVELTAGTVPEALRVEDGYISDSNDVRHSSKIAVFHAKPDENGECWFSVLAIPHPLSPGRLTGTLKQTVPPGGGDSLLLDVQAEGRSFRLALRGNTLERILKQGKVKENNILNGRKQLCLKN